MISCHTLWSWASWSVLCACLFCKMIPTSQGSYETTCAHLYFSSIRNRACRYRSTTFVWGVLWVCWWNDWATLDESQEVVLSEQASTANQRRMSHNALVLFTFSTCSLKWVFHCCLRSLFTAMAPHSLRVCSQGHCAQTPWPKAHVLCTRERRLSVYLDFLLDSLAHFILPRIILAKILSMRNGFANFLNKQKKFVRNIF